MSVSPLILPSPELARERERLLASRFYLVKLGTLGEKLRCRNCGGHHPYLTLRCQPQPFNGLSRGLFAYYRTVGDAGAAGFLGPTERARFDRIAGLFGDQPDLATSHPRLAREISPSGRDLDHGAVALGVLEPLTREQAVRFAARIRAAGAAFRLPGLTGREQEV